MSEAKHNRNRKTGFKLAGLVVLMFGFGFALVPLYELVCEVTGIETLEQRREARNLRQDVEAIGLPVQDRSITVRFDVTVNPNLPWSMTPEVRKMDVVPGKAYLVDFNAVNRSGQMLNGQRQTPIHGHGRPPVPRRVRALAPGTAGLAPSSASTCAPMAP